MGDNKDVRSTIEDVGEKAEPEEQIDDEEDSESESEMDAEDTPKSNPLQFSAGREPPAKHEAQEKMDAENRAEDGTNGNSEADSEADIDETSANIDDGEAAINASKTSRPDSTIPSSKPSSTKQTIIRGKKGKAKKAAQKYAHQDEEDRELALRLLGVNTNANKAAETAAAAAKAKREAELEAQKKRRRAQHERAAEAERKRQEQFFNKNAAAAAAGGEAEDEAYDEEAVNAEAEDLSWLPALVGTPLPEDEVLATLPVAAPWSAVARFKYRAKLQAGSVKKGKAIKEILGHWIIEASGSTGVAGNNKIGKKVIADDIADGMVRATAERMRAREADLLKGWRDVEVMNTLPVGKVRIVSGGATGGGGGGKGGGKGGNSGKSDKGKGSGGAPKGGKGGKKK